MGHSPSGENYTSNPQDHILVQGNADISNGWVSPRVWTTQVTKLIEPGNILLSVRAPVGQVGKTLYPVVIGRGIASLDGDEFVFQLLKRMQLNNYWRKVSTGSTFESISSKDINNALIKLPIEIERERIGEFLKSLDNYTELHQRKIIIIQSLRKFIISLTTRVLELPYPLMRFKNFDSEWELHKINEIFTITRGKVLSSNLINTTKNEEYRYPVYSSQTKNNGLMGYFDSYLFEDAITWTTDGANAGTVNYRPGKFYSTNVNGVLLSQKGYSNKCITEILDKVAWKYVSKVGNPKLMNNTMSNIRIYIPSDFKEQFKLSELFMVLDNYIAFNKKKVDQLNKLKKAYLQKMFL